MRYMLGSCMFVKVILFPGKASFPRPIMLVFFLSDVDDLCVIDSKCLRVLLELDVLSTQGILEGWQMVKTSNLVNSDTTEGLSS